MTTKLDRSMTAPTEAEIREAIDTSPLLQPDCLDEPEGLYRAFRVILDSDMALVRAGWQEDFGPARDHPGTLWADMRASEFRELSSAVEAARSEAFRDYLIAVRERVVAATLAFAEANPDISRGAWRPAGDREAVPA
jgi:hypothetical protein